MYNIVKINDTTWAFENVMSPTDCVRFFLVLGDDSALVIDSGFAANNVKSYICQFMKDNDLVVSPAGKERNIIMANTHGDKDHVGGNSSFDAFYMMEEDYINCGVKAQCPSSTLIPVTDGLEIELGNRTLRFITVPGHTKGNTVILDVNNRMLFAGDTIQTANIFMFNSHRDPSLMMGSLIKLQGMKDQFDTIIASHGKLILDVDSIDKVIEDWNDVLNKKIEPITINVHGMDIYNYRGKFCNFFCGIE